MLKTLWAAIQCGRFHGKGHRCRKRGDLGKAVMHFKQALPYAEKTGNLGTMAFELECIAITCLEMRNTQEAKEYAESSLKLYRSLAEQGTDDVFAKGVSRMEQALREIET